MGFEKIKVYAFVGPSGTGKSYRAQMVASENDINFIIDDGLLICFQKHILYLYLRLNWITFFCNIFY